MHWGPDKLMKICTDEIGIDPKTGAVFLFFNKAKDKLKIFFLDDDGSQEVMRVLPKNSFMVPVAKKKDRYVKIDAKLLPKLFRSG
jgi:hypothetical protein